MFSPRERGQLNEHRHLKWVWYVLYRVCGYDTNLRKVCVEGTAFTRRRDSATSLPFVRSSMLRTTRNSSIAATGKVHDHGRGFDPSNASVVGLLLAPMRKMGLYFPFKWF